ncbi:hypothetical protein LXG23DRAFT_35739 [Yarrowia lipolytica]|nr:hypothetical protein BKA91DRAFT_166317 [Yarrowia lipolytica]KAJ8056104.1 hypothetical protein LXG23DRAFT_35739 [Yarrowia lipolytica]
MPRAWHRPRYWDENDFDYRTGLANGLVTLTELRSGYFFGVNTPPDVLPDDHPVYQGQFDDFGLGHRLLTRRHRQEYMKSWGQHISPLLEKLLGFKTRAGKPLRDTRGVKHAQKLLFAKGSIRENIARREQSGSKHHNRLLKAALLPNLIVTCTWKVRTAWIYRH